MGIDTTVPDLHRPICNAEQVSLIFNRPRATITGWINRYDWLDIPLVARGSTRRFSFVQIGRLAALRSAIDAGQMIEPLLNAVDPINELEGAIEAEFKRLFDGRESLAIDPESFADEALPRLDNPVLLVRQDLLGVQRFLVRYSQGEWYRVTDTSGFRLPETTIHLGDVLRNAWSRALVLLNGGRIVS